MPGMMETVLNIGLNEETLRGLVRLTGNPKFAWDCMLRLIQQYGEVVHDLSAQPFAQILRRHLQAIDAAGPEELDIEALKSVVMEFEDIFQMKTGRLFPTSPEEQLLAAIEAVMRSWYGKRAATYRRLHAFSDDIGTAVIVQVMVFGNTGRNSGSGVDFTRNPANGKKELYLDYLSNTQGEDIVSGRRNADHADILALHLPKVHAELLQICCWLEQEFRDMQDFEFTVEQGRLYLLQSRSGKRTSLAALKVAVDMVEEGIIEPARAAELIAGYDPAGFRRNSLAITSDDKPVAGATSAGTGVAVGAAVFDTNRIERYLGKGIEVIYLGRTISTDDIEIMHRVQGMVIAQGARTSHAAVVARQLGRVCLVACTALRISDDLRHGYLGETRVKEGDILSLYGGRGTDLPGTAGTDHLLSGAAAGKGGRLEALPAGVGKEKKTGVSRKQPQ
jgi:pyruvate,orthophosphate dikinase